MELINESALSVVLAIVLTMFVLEMGLVVRNRAKPSDVAWAFVVLGLWALALFVVFYGYLLVLSIVIGA